MKTVDTMKVKVCKTVCPITASLQKLTKRSSISDDSMTFKTESSSSSGDDLMDSTHMSRREQDCVDRLKDFCLSNTIPLNDHTIFRFACFHNFNFEVAKEAIDENRDNYFLGLKMQKSLAGQLSTKAMFPLPGLKTATDDSEILYLRPSRHNPEKVDCTKVIESLCYIFNDMSDTEEKCRTGVSVISNLKGFTQEHFNYDQWYQFMMTLQGKIVPTKVNLILIVNAPSWFEKTIWKKMKTTMPQSFSKKVHVISDSKLGDYLMEDYRAYLPDELANGYRSSQEIVEDYVDLKAFQDKQKRLSH